MMMRQSREKEKDLEQFSGNTLRELMHNNGAYSSDSDSDSDDDADDDSSSSSDDDSEHANNDTAAVTSGDAAGKATVLVWRETRAVLQSKAFLFVALFVLGIAGSVMTYFLVLANNKTIYQMEFSSNANEVAATANGRAGHSFSVVGSFSKSITNMMLNSDEVFPFYTHPNFDDTASEVRNISGSDMIALLPRVKLGQLQKWNEYSQTMGPQWLKEGLEYRGLGNIDPGSIPPVHFLFSNASQPYNNLSIISGEYLPLWQMAGAPVNASIINLDLLSAHSSFKNVAEGVLSTQAGVVSDATLSNSYWSQLSISNDSSLVKSQNYLNYLMEEDGVAVHMDEKEQIIDLPAISVSSYFMQPVFKSFPASESSIVAFVAAFFTWNSYFDNVLVEGENGIYVVVNDACGTIFTYILNGPISIFIGMGDLHDSFYDEYRVEVDVATFARTTGSKNVSLQSSLDNSNSNTSERRTIKDYILYRESFSDTDDGSCHYTLAMYPSATFQTIHHTKNAGLMAFAVGAVFLAIIGLLMFYDYMVTRRQNRLMEVAQKTDAFVETLFPKAFKQKMFQESDPSERTETSKKKAVVSYLKSIAENKSDGATDADFSSCMPDFSGDPVAITESNSRGKPIADLYPETTVFFADIAGFTAWSSVREPTQVFELLEHIYHAFDKIAERRRVFKVETVGDCYVAVVGLPVPREDHAVVMVRFARDCLVTFNKAVKDLEVSLGPETADLGLRVGLHSGPVTAGVLRGERSRFQLFGDTVNTASRMESNGKRDCIHFSQDTADLLVEAGKGHWIEPRLDRIVAKGKGEMQTYWLIDKAAAAVHSVSFENSFTEREPDPLYSRKTVESTVSTDRIQETSDLPSPEEMEKDRRLVEWTSECLLRFLKEIEARRQFEQDSEATNRRLRELECQPYDLPLNEVTEIIVLPTWQGGMNDRDVESMSLPHEVQPQLREYVATIAQMYRRNPFHNFEHASHVVMSVIKLLARIVGPDLEVEEDYHNKTLHDHTYGITSDPLTRFACAFSALIHDVDHTGLSNMQLVDENLKLAAIYNGKSIAEQNSVDQAWTLLMDDSFEQLRRAIYRTESEFIRFRQLVVNSVMATDIMDKDLKQSRNLRWEKAFNIESKEENHEVTTNRKATIVIEHLIQASDVAHTMQHWHVYRKWNERLFLEMYIAYKQGRGSNPADFWYEGEIGFYDFYIIPLAKKLKDCGVFGVSSDEYLNYAQRNRKEWEANGREAVNEMKARVERIASNFPDFSRSRQRLPSRNFLDH